MPTLFQGLDLAKGYLRFPKARWRDRTFPALLPSAQGSLRHMESLHKFRFLASPFTPCGADPKWNLKRAYFQLGKGNWQEGELKFPLLVKLCCPHLPIKLEACRDAIFPWFVCLPGFDTTFLQKQLFIKDVLHSAEIKESEQMALNIFPPCNDGK